jgi:hypothetical protein
MSSFSTDGKVTPAGKFSVKSMFDSVFVIEPNLSSKARAPHSLYP